MDEEGHFYLFVLVGKLFLQLPNHAFLGFPARSTVFIVRLIGCLWDQEEEQQDNMSR